MRASIASINRRPIDVTGLGWVPCIPYGYDYMTGEPDSQCGSISDQMPCVTNVPQFPGSAYCPTVMPGFPVSDVAGYPTGLSGLRGRGLGDCGADPCGFTDYFFPSAACSAYNLCATAAAAVALPNTPFSSLTAAQQAAFIDAIPAPVANAPTAGDLAAQAAGAAPGTPFASLTAAQQAAYIAATPEPPAAPQTFSEWLASLPTWVPYAAGGFALLLLMMTMGGGGRRR